MALLAGMLALSLGVPATGAPTDTALASQPAAPATSSETTGATLDDPWSSPDIAAPRMDNQPLARRDQGGTWNATRSSDGGRTSAAWFRTTLALGGVVGLILLLGWGYRRVAGGGSLGAVLRGRQPGLIEIISRTSISPRHSLCLVRVGPRMILLGCTQDAVRPLDVIQDADLVARLAGEAVRQRPDSHTAAFSQVLETEARSYHDEDDDEAVTPDDARLGDVRDKVSQTIQRLRQAAAKI